VAAAIDDTIPGEGEGVAAVPSWDFGGSAHTQAVEAGLGGRRRCSHAGGGGSSCAQPGRRKEITSFYFYFLVF
jgi:hypothetical protein